MKTLEQGQTKLEMHSQELVDIRKEIKNSNRNLIITVILGFVGVITALWFF
jgi:ABC-type Fe3+-citrate transport system substrate-binding protein